MNGVVKWFNSKKGYGFISKGENEKDIFVHFSDINSDGYKSLKPGDKVSFEVGKNDKGEKAIKVEVIK